MNCELNQLSWFMSLLSHGPNDGVEMQRAIEFQEAIEKRSRKRKIGHDEALRQIITQFATYA